MFGLPFRFLAGIVLILTLGAAGSARGTSTRAPPPSASAPPGSALDYPDSTSGLEHLVKDIIKAQKENDGARADALLISLILPNPREWYDLVFGGDVGETPESQYEKSATTIPSLMARFFLNAQSENMNEIHAVRFDQSCDDNAGEDAFGILHARHEPVPLYELRFIRGDKFRRVFAFAFLDGAFRYILTPKMEGKVFGGPRRKPPSASETAALANSSDLRVRVGGTVQAAKLLKRVQPLYPALARREQLQGTVKLHALIGKDGSLQKV